MRHAQDGDYKADLQVRSTVDSNHISNYRPLLGPSLDVPSTPSLASSAASSACYHQSSPRCSLSHTPAAAVCLPKRPGGHTSAVLHCGNEAVSTLARLPLSVSGHRTHRHTWLAHTVTRRPQPSMVQYCHLCRLQVITLEPGGLSPSHKTKARLLLVSR